MNTYKKKIKQYGRKNLGHVSGYVSGERGATVSCFFIGYFEGSRGFKFYYLSNKNIIETDNAKFVAE